MILNTLTTLLFSVWWSYGSQIICWKTEKKIIKYLTKDKIKVTSKWMKYNFFCNLITFFLNEWINTKQFENRNSKVHLRALRSQYTARKMFFSLGFCFLSFLFFHFYEHDITRNIVRSIFYYQKYKLYIRTNHIYADINLFIYLKLYL